MPDTAVNQNTGSSSPFQLTWIDLSFVNYVPVPGTRFADFSDVNFGGAIRFNFMILNIKPLWLSASVMVDANVTNSIRLDRIIDIGIGIGAGWRFTLYNRFYLTPRFLYGFMGHAAYGDYYNAPDIYPGDPRAGTKRNHFFSDQYLRYEAEFAYDVSPRSRSLECEIFFSPGFIHFVEQHKQGLEFGYQLGVRMKVDSLFKPAKILPPGILAGKVVDAETGKVLAKVVPVLDGAKADKTELARGETFAYKINADEDYTIRAEYEGYEPLIREVNDNELTSGKKTTLLLPMKVSRVYGIFGHVFEKGSKSPLKNVDIIVVDAKGNKKEMETDRKGNFRMELQPDTDYEVLLKKRKYFTVRGKFTSKGKKPGWFDVTKFMRTEFQKVVLGATMEYDKILYDSGRWNIRPDVAPELDKIITFLSDNSTIVVELGAHTDALGASKPNLTLSEKRAKSAVDYLIKRGFDAARITSKGYGETSIKNRCKDGVVCSRSEHQENRRTEIKVIKILND